MWCGHVPLREVPVKHWLDLCAEVFLYICAVVLVTASFVQLLSGVVK